MSNCIDNDHISTFLPGPVCSSVDLKVVVNTGIKIQSFTPAWGTQEAHEFKYPSDHLNSVFQGAIMRIATPAGAVLPVLWTSSDPKIASVDNDGVVTWLVTASQASSWTGCAGVTFEVIDADGNTAQAIFKPTFYYVSIGIQRTLEQVQVWCEHYHVPMPTVAELTNSQGSTPAYRACGTMWGEWGNIVLQGWPASVGKYGVWTGDPSINPNTFNVVYYSDGSISQDHSWSEKAFDGMCGLLSTGPNPA